MSQENVKIARAFTDAFNAHDTEALIAYCDPNGEFHSTFAAVGGAVYRGHDGVRQWHRDLEQEFGDEIHVEAEAFFDLGDKTLVYNRISGRGKKTGAEIALEVTTVAKFRDGLCTYYAAYIHREDALRDLGVSEDALEPIEP